MITLMRTPDCRYILLQKKLTGQDPIVDVILADPTGPEAVLFEQALILYTSKLKRSYLEASFMASDDLGKISNLLKIPEAVLETYRNIFFDVANLDRLSRLELLESFDGSDSNMKLWAVSLGLDFIAWRLGERADISPVEGLKDLFVTCFYKAKEAMFNANASTASKEGLKWTKLSMDIARLLKAWVMDSDEAKKDLELAIQSVIPEFKSLEDLDGFDLPIIDTTLPTIGEQSTMD